LNGLEKELKFFAAQPPQNMHLRFFQGYGELDIKKSEIMASIAFLPSKIRCMIMKQPNEITSKIVVGMKELMEK